MYHTYCVELCRHEGKRFSSVSQQNFADLFCATLVWIHEGVTKTRTGSIYTSVPELHSKMVPMKLVSINITNNESNFS